jgi:hypothetical protein
MKPVSTILLGTSSFYLFLVACNIFVPNNDPVVPGREGIFPHAVHVDDEVAMDCVDCHDMVETDDIAGMPTLDVCRTCHDPEEDIDYPTYSQLVSFTLPGDEEATWSSVTETPLDLNFSHGLHYDADVDCSSCHEGVMESNKTSWSWAVSMDACMTCHEGSDVGPLACEECHSGLGVDDFPSNHDTGWVEMHGMFSSVDDLHSPVQAMNCALCHTEETCDSCHRTTQPRSHSEPWRVKGHGFNAQMDRDSCATCHTEASCVECHQTSTPSNHGGIWGGNTNAHCIGCHLPLDEGDNCSVCHSSTPSHNQAPLRPGPAHPGSSADCNSCHAPLDHLENGQDCSTCHY